MSRPRHGPGAVLRAAGLFVVFCILALAPGRQLRAQEVPAGFEQGLYEVRIPRTATVTLAALVDSSGAVLVPVVPVLELTGIPFQRSRGDSLLSLPALGGGGRSTLDLAARAVVRPDGRIGLGGRDAVVVGREVYLHTERLAELLQATLAVDPAALVVTVSRTPPFPAEQEAAAASRRARVRPATRSAGPPVPYAARSGAGVLDWGISATGDDLLGGYTLRSQAGVALWGGDLSAGGTLAARGSGLAGASDWNWSYRRGFPTSPLVRQVEVGDIVTGGALLRSVRGVSVTNARVVRDPFFSSVLVSPDVPQGWEYEVYQNGELLGFSDGVSRGPVPVPLRYGSTPLQVRMYSPAGEEVVSEVLYQVPPTQLSPGRVEYSAGAGVCPHRGCEYLAYASVDAGVAPWLTLGGGLEASSDSLREAVLPNASVGMAWISGWAAQLEAAKSSYLRAQAGYYGNRPVNATLTAGINYPGAGQPSFIPTLRPRWYAESLLSVRFPWSVRALRTEARVEAERGGPVDRARVAGTLDIPRGTVDAGYEYDRVRDGGLLTLSGLILTPDRGSAWLRNRPVTLGIGIGDGVELLQAGTSLQMGASGYLVFASRWDLETRAPSLTVNYSLSTRFARTQARLAATPGRATLATATMNGGLSWDRGTGVVPLAYGGVRDAGVSGVVFYDQDGDGVLDGGDRPAAGVEVLVGSSRARTDSAGVYRTWNVVPYEVSEVSVDTLRRIDASWIPLTRGVRLRPTPHMYNRVDFPLVQTRELAGRLEAAPGVATAGGVTLELRELSGDRAQSLVTFSDGEFYVSRVRPGEYELSVSPASLRVLRARPEPAAVRFRVSPAGDDLLMELDPIRLVPEDS